MSIIEARWRERQSRYEDGIYFATDDFIKLRGTPGEGYRADARAPTALLLQSDPDGWTDLGETCAAKIGDFQLFVGSTSWEGSGFIAVEQQSTGRLLWLLHLTNAEPFTEVSLDGLTVRATSEAYPLRFEWRIPIHLPESFTVAQSHAA